MAHPVESDYKPNTAGDSKQILRSKTHSEDYDSDATGNFSSNFNTDLLEQALQNNMRLTEINNSLEQYKFLMNELHQWITKWI